MGYRRLAKDTIIYGGTDLLGKLINFITFPIIANILMPKDFGMLEIILSTSSFIGIFLSCGVNNAVQKYYFEVPEHTKKQVLTMGFLVVVSFSLIFIILSIFFIILKNYFSLSFINNLNYLSYFSLVLFTVLIQINTFLLDIFRNNFESKKFFSYSLFYKTLLAMGTLILVLFYLKNIDGYILAQFIVSLLLFILLFYNLKKNFIFKTNLYWILKLIKFGYPFVLVGIVYWVFSYTDRWMLSYLSNFDEVGYYSVAYRFGTIITFISFAFGNAWGPWAFKLKKDESQNYKHIYGNILLQHLFVMIFISTFLILFSDEIIKLVMSKEYWKSTSTLKVISFGLLFQSTQQITGIGISLEGKTTIFSKLILVTSLLNIGFNYILIPKFGALGAAIATTINHLILTLFYLRKTVKYGHMEIKYDKLIVLLLISFFSLCFSLLYPAEKFNLSFILCKIALFSLLNIIIYNILPFKVLKFFKDFLKGNIS